MFDQITASLLRSAPEVPGLNPNEIPQLLTRRYAELASARLRGAEGSLTSTDDEWPLERIADTYELLTSISENSSGKRASAFVAATAHQILSRQTRSGEADAVPPPLHRDAVDPTVASALLFLAAEQYADANEASLSIKVPRQGLIYEVRILTEHLKDLAAGKLRSILDRAARWRRIDRPNYALQTRAMLALVESLITGIELLAAEMLSEQAPTGYGRFESARHAFQLVLELSTNSEPQLGEELPGLVTAYAGPRHLAALLLAASDGIHEAALTRVPPPAGAKPNFWKLWLQHRARTCPFVWPNHREAIDKDFYQTGKSAVVVLPTGAGKTTVSSLKIAGVLARKKKVVFLAPTHALVEQLTEDLQEMFPKELLGSVVSSDFDLLLMADATLKEIEVMTPERCLAMLSFAPDAFKDVGLMVFDECHLLSPQSGKIRRALDGMLCVLAFNRVAPEADTLFLSAMLKNGEQFANWIASLTGRECVFVDLLWKPSRQARGVVIFEAQELKSIRQAAIAEQKLKDAEASKPAKALRKAARNKLAARPWAIWGLQHNWLSKTSAICSLTPISDENVILGGELSGQTVRLTPNANLVAARLAVSAARNSVKTIVFVNTKADAVSTADEISDQLEVTIDATEAEQDRWTALELELGDLKHSLVKKGTGAVPHNSAMLRLERDLAERAFRRSDGAKVIVATPTLAQGLNLPAQLAILAGDKRASADKKGREDLEAHELLNAAARAGRAGHLANGVVLLVPEPIISFTDGKSLTTGAQSKLASILPEDDRCVTIDDPLEVILDRLMQGETEDRDVRYTINRMAVIRDTADDSAAASAFNLMRSLGAYAAKAKSTEHEFEMKLAALQAAVEQARDTGSHAAVEALASQSGLPAAMLQSLRTRLESEIGSLPTDVIGWVQWTLNWLSADQEARSLLLQDVARAIAGSTGRKKDSEITPEALADLTPGVIAWLKGEPLSEIEKTLGGDPDGSPSARVCPRARELVGTVIPRGISFIVSLVSHVVEDINPFEVQESLSSELVEALSAAVRKGFDTIPKLRYSAEHAHILGRVQAHNAWVENSTTELF